MTAKKKLPAHTKGSGNIFADLGLPRAEKRLTEAIAVTRTKRKGLERKSAQTMITSKKRLVSR